MRVHAIWCAAIGRYYHPDMPPGAGIWADAAVWDDVGEAGYVADQLNTRDRGLTVRARGRITILDDSAWRVVDRPVPYELIGPPWWRWWSDD